MVKVDGKVRIEIFSKYLQMKKQTKKNTIFTQKLKVHKKVHLET